MHTNKGKQPSIIGFNYVDIFQSTKLEQENPNDKVTRTLDRYDSLIEETFKTKTYLGVLYEKAGDGHIYYFPSPFKAVQASIDLLDCLVNFNEKGNSKGSLIDTPIFARIGVHQFECNEDEKKELFKTQKSSQFECGEDEKKELSKKTQKSKPEIRLAPGELSIAGKLQKNCPIGRIAVSSKVYANIRIYRKLFKPSSIELNEKIGTESFVLSPRFYTGYEIESELFKSLPDEQKELIPPIIFSNSDDLKPDFDINLTKVREFFNKKVMVVIGSTTKTAKPNSETPIASAATSDAVGIMEVIAQLGANPEIRVGVPEWEDTAVLASESNLLVVGGISNLYSFAINDLFNAVHFVGAQGRMFNQIVATSKTGGRVRFGKFTPFPENSALVLIARNPFGLEKKTLLWVAGITGMGTQAASSLILDLVKYSDDRKKLGIDFDRPPVACVVAPDIPGGPWPWRILKYKVLWAIDRDDNPICVKGS